MYVRYRFNHARAQLRAHSITPPADPEPLLATYLNRFERSCAALRSAAHRQAAQLLLHRARTRRHRSTKPAPSGHCVTDMVLSPRMPGNERRCTCMGPRSNRHDPADAFSPTQKPAAGAARLLESDLNPAARHCESHKQTHQPREPTSPFSRLDTYYTSFSPPPLQIVTRRQ